MSMFDDIVKRKQKEWNCDSLMDGYIKDSQKKIPLSSLLLNHSLYGGIPRNRITEFCGENGGGKSTTAIDVCKNAIEIFKQEHEEQIAELRSKVSQGSKPAAAELEDLIESGPKKVLYIDLEHSFDSHWSKVLGINRDEINITGID